MWAADNARFITQDLNPKCVQRLDQELLSHDKACPTNGGSQPWCHPKLKTMEVDKWTPSVVMIKVCVCVCIWHWKYTQDNKKPWAFESNAFTWFFCRKLCFCKNFMILSSRWGFNWSLTVLAKIRVVGCDMMMFIYLQRNLPIKTILQWQHTHNDQTILPAIEKPLFHCKIVEGHIQCKWLSNNASFS